MFTLPTVQVYLYKQNPKPNLRMFSDIYFLKTKSKATPFQNQKLNLMDLLLEGKF
jgi:hypothetical protein